MAMMGLPASAMASGATFNVRQYGAAGDGTRMDTAALQQAIDAAANAGGGTVAFPPGRYLSASLDLKSHVTLQLDEGATLLGSPHRQDYRPGKVFGLLRADQLQDIGVCGKGTIDGQGILLAADTERLSKEKKLPNAKEFSRPMLISFRNCKNVTIRDSRSRTAHPGSNTIWIASISPSKTSKSAAFPSRTTMALTLTAACMR